MGNYVAKTNDNIDLSEPIKVANYVYRKNNIVLNDLTLVDIMADFIRQKCDPEQFYTFVSQQAESDFENNKKI